jgi:hypothetical protein
VGLPFTTEQFFGVFAGYNRAFIVAVVALWVASLAILAHVSRDPSPRSSRLSLFLAVLWLWNAVFYHALFFTRINPAAWLFAGLFLAQAVLFLWAATQRRIEYFTSTGWTRIIGSGLIGYALLYPFLTIVLGHRYPATPTFGVPCPTDLLTIGALLTARAHVPVALAIIPVIWGVIGGSAAMLLEVRTDYVLLGAGVLLATLLIGQRFQATVVRQ